MAVIIKDIDMPNCCYDCFFWDNMFNEYSVRPGGEWDYRCVASREEIAMEDVNVDIENSDPWWQQKRHDKCPLESVENISLQAQRVRVLTLEEVRNLKNEDVVYLEDFDKPDLLVGVFYAVDMKITNVSFFTSKGHIFPDIKDDYGKRWRCWNTKPTDKQRKVAKWHD